VGDVIGVREKSKSLEAVSESLASNSKTFDWLEWNPSQMEGKVVAVPNREMIPENIKEQLIVELYSK
jgi:small subunit ribosomal protein S4